MADKNRNFVAPSKSTKFKRPSTVTGASSQKTALASAVKSRAGSCQKVNKNATTVGDCDVTLRQESGPSDHDPVLKQIAYGKFLRTMLADCLIDEKIQREETNIDVQMALLCDRFKKTMEQLDNTSRRLKDLSFVVEQQRLLDLRSQDCVKFYDFTDNSNVKDVVNNLTLAEQTRLDRLEMKNVDFGYNKDSGHKQLLDTVDEALNGLEQIKKHWKLDASKFEEFKKSDELSREVKTCVHDLEGLKSEFDVQFPRFTEKLLSEMSEKLAAMMKSDNDADDVDDDDD